MKYGEVTAPIDKSPDEMLFLRKEAKLFRDISQLRRMQVSENNKKTQLLGWSQGSIVTTRNILLKVMAGALGKI